MLTLAVLSGPWPRLGVIAVALLAGGAMLLRDDRFRAASMLGALVLAPVLLLDDVWSTPHLHFVHRHPAEAVVAAIFVLAMVAVAAWVLWRWPRLVAPLAMVALPFRIPLQTAGTAAQHSANLLIPLYFVIAAASLAWIVPTLRSSRPAATPAAGTSRLRSVTLVKLLLAGFVVLYALQALYTVDFQAALQNVVFFYVPFMILLTLLAQMDWDRRLLGWCLGVTIGLALILALIGFGEEWTKTLFWNPNLIAADQQHRYFTVNSLFYDPNIFGRYLALTMLLTTSVLLYNRRVALQLGSCAVLAILWACLIFTLSRSSLAALAVGLAVLAAMRWKTWPVLALAGTLVVLGIAALAISPHTFGINQGLNNASSGRANLITGGVKLFGQRPVAGYGSGSFSTEYSRKFPNAARSVSDSHNIAVTVASEQGVIGLMVYIALVLAALVALFRGARGDPPRVAIAAAFVGLLVHTMLYADFLEDPTTWVLLGIGGALAIAAQQTSGEVTNARPAAVRQEPPRELHRA